LTLHLEGKPELPVVLLLDRAPWYRTNPVEKVLEDNPRLEIICFPLACPDLNPQKNTRKAAINEVSYNHLEPGLSEWAGWFEKKMNSYLFATSFLERHGDTEIRPMFS